MVSKFTGHFDRLADRYSELRASSAFVDPVTEAVVALGNLRGCRVLDVGCGPGSVLSDLILFARSALIRKHPR